MKKILTIGLIFVGVFLVFTGQEETEVSKSPPGPAQVHRTTKPTSKKTASLQRKKQRRERRNFVKMLKAGMVPTTAEVSQGKSLVNFTFKPIVRQCELGDLDIIALDQKRRKRGKGITMEIENLATGKVVARKRLSLSTLSGGQVSFNLATSSQSQAYGVLICSGKKNCSQASAQNLNHILKRNMLGKAPTSKKVLYYKQFFFAKKNNLFAGVMNTKRQATALEKSFQASGLSQSEARRTRRALEESNRKLSSLALRPEQNKLVISLPRNSDDCPIPI